MDGRITGFIVWAVFGCMFIGLAIYVWFSKKPAGFWANVETLEVFDIKKYNHAVAKLFGIFGIDNVFRAGGYGRKHCGNGGLFPWD